ncbi:MAG: PD-(D/E)XK nuclease family transposase [Erysipelotrichales bacterium]|nr:PD-(D/E)XK nuclease family transposase [Erysipelotrichales bacterium]
MTSKLLDRTKFDRCMLEKAPLRDYGFHKIFDPTTEDGKQCIGFLLRSICGMVDVEIDTLLPRRYEGEKGEKKTTESDIRIIVNKEYHVVIEMQLIATKEFLLRSGFYTASEIANQLDSGELHLELKQTIMICLMDEVKFKEGKKGKYIRKSRMCDEDGEERTGFPYVYDVYLGRLVNKEIDYSKYDVETILAVFAQVMYNKDDEEIKSRIKEYIMKGEGVLMEGLDKIVDKVEYINNDQASREELIADYWEYQMQMGIKREYKNEGIEEGIQIGREEGIEIGKQEGIEIGVEKSIVSMSKNGYKESEIATALSLSLEYVCEVLREDNK